MPHLEHVHVARHRREALLRGRARIAREQQRAIAVAHPRDHRMLVHVGHGAQRSASRAENLDRDAVERHPIPGPRRPPFRARCLHGRQELEVQRLSQRGARLEYAAHGQRLEQRGQAADVIGVPVRGHDQRHLAGAVPPQKRHHHAATRVAGRAARAGVHHHPMPRRGAQHHRIALPDVQEMYR